MCQTCSFDLSITGNCILSFFISFRYLSAVFLLFLQPLVNNGMYRPLGYALIISAVTDIISGVLFSYSAVEFIKNNRDFGLEDDEREE